MMSGDGKKKQKETRGSWARSSCPT